MARAAEDGMKLRISVVLALGLAILSLTGCSDDEGGGIYPPPVLWLDVTPDSAVVEVGESIRVEAMVCGTCESEITWYVNHVSGGNSEFGVITQTNPATYTAPDRMPFPASVSIMAVSDEDQSKAAGCNITITHTRVYVDVEAGDDGAGTGAATRPVRTITRGVEIARPGAAVHVAAGEYKGDTGEIFPIVLNDGITLIGDDREGVRISDTLSTLIQIVGTDCSVRRLHMTKDDGSAIHVMGTSERALIDSISMPHTGAGVGVLIDGARETVVRDCSIISGRKCYCGYGIKMVGGDMGTVVQGCELMGFWQAAYLDSTSDALIEGCVMGINQYPVYLSCNDDPGSGPSPDLGGGARGGHGGNTIRYPGGLGHRAAGNRHCGLTNLTPNTIYARNNTWYTYPPQEGSDYCNPNGGQVIW
jgi:hypothetical protein